MITETVRQYCREAGCADCAGEDAVVSLLDINSYSLAELKKTWWNLKKYCDIFTCIVIVLSAHKTNNLEDKN